MSTSNPRVKQRKGALQDYNGQQHMVPGGAPVVPPPPSQPTPMIPNGNANVQQPANISFVMPSVDATHSNHMTQAPAYRNPPRGLQNPSMTFGPEEVHVERPPPGSPQMTIIRQRYPTQTQPQYTPSSQVNAFTSAPPTAIYNPPSVFTGAYNNAGVFQTYPGPSYYPQVVPQPTVFATPYYPAQQPAEFMPPRGAMNYPQPPLMVPTPQQPSAQPPKEKKILKIVDPETKQVTNEKEITASMSSSADEQHNISAENIGERPSISSTDPAREPPSHPPSASQTLSRKVAQLVLGDTADASSSAPAAAATTQPTTHDVSTAAPQAVAAPSTSAPVSSSPPLQEVRPAQEAEAVAEGKTAETAETVAISEKEESPQKEATPAPPESTEVHSVLTSEPEEVQASSTLHAEQIPSTMSGRVVDAVIEETEKEEKATEDEGKDEAGERERKQKELEQRQKDLLRNPDIVNLATRFYNREYLFLMRDFVQELKKSACPVEESELKNLGIDMASAPAVGTMERQRRYDNPSGGPRANFNPHWLEKVPPKPRANYHGRLSDRTHAGQRDRDRKRAPLPARPSIDRPAREPVKLHKAEHAWKPDKSQTDESQLLYKKVRGLLNKITPSTFEVLSAEFLKLKVYENKEQMDEIINIIFDKAVEEPKFCPLYSDLCKKQVVDETNVSRKSEFRSGILSRCQQTFETKRQEEIKRKKAEAEAEKDEKKQKELMIEWMEMDAKERRRMFGNIGFIGQLFRHELIVPKILNWCIIHLLKNHCDTPNGDEESIECAVRMLETVGMIADAHGKDSKRQEEFNINLYFSHLEDLVTKVSNRVRFLILNLIELRKNNWVPRKSAESGPKTIEEVHVEARKEELENKVLREQYDHRKRGYDGRASLDKRGQRSTVIGRQSQDGRYNRGGDSRDRDMRAKAAGVAASSIANTGSSRKNQTLNSVDQGQSLDAKRPGFVSGSGGGGQQKYSDLRSERSSALAVTSMITRGSTGGYANVAASGSFSALSSMADEKPSAAQTEEEKQTKPDFDEKALYSRIGSELSEYCHDISSIEDVYNGIKEECEKTTPEAVFRLMLQYGVEKVSSAGGSQHRRYVGQVICRCLQSDKKNQGLQGIADFCTYAVENELWLDHQRLWECVAEILSWSIMCDTEHFDGPRPSLGDYKQAFICADADKRKPHALLVNVLKSLAEIEMEKEQHDTPSSTAMALEEVNELFTESLNDELRKTKLKCGENLFTLLK